MARITANATSSAFAGEGAFVATFAGPPRPDWGRGLGGEGCAKVGSESISFSVGSVLHDSRTLMPGPGNSRDLATAVAKGLRDAGHRALFAGGCVRDLLLEREPKDFDVATSATPEEVMRIFPRTAPVGASFGVVLVMPDGHTPVEVATFRRDLGYTDHRRPDAVAFTDEREDAQRRDFTINGLFLDPVTGEILDYVGGRDDLARGILRAIGNPGARIAEDRLRMLRAIRFATRYHFTIEAATWAAVREHASTVVHVSAERIRDELVRMFTEGDAAVALELLDHARLLAVVLPEVAELRAVSPWPELGAAGDGFVHTQLVLSALAARTPVLAIAALLHETGRTSSAMAQSLGSDVIADRALRRLRFSNDERERVVELLRGLGSIASLPSSPPREWKRALRHPRVHEQLELDRAVSIARGGDLTAHSWCLQRLAETAEAELRPAPLLDGRELQALGVARGPAIGALLAELEDLQLDGVLHDREAAIDHVRGRSR